ncbi:MlaD family protein [Nocardia tengchongensis]|uniref:MlaD family protein n=1 Tax=Nocardia tengchongensis TaxID=2055889 RepID=UPI00360ABB54
MTRRSRPAGRIGLRALLISAVVLAVGGCDLQPADLPVPGSGVGGPTYHLRIEFTNVLNLPQGAKVIADGVRVGQLTGVTVVDPGIGTSNQLVHRGFVIADVAIRDSVRLPVGTTAELRQETPLGDVHIALTEPAKAAAAELAPGGTIPLADTTQSPPIEDILAGLATFVGGGAISDMQSIVRKMNAVLPQDPRDTARIAGVLGADLSDLGDHLNSVDSLLDGLQATVDDGLKKNVPILDDLLTDEGVQHTTDSVNAQIGVIFVLTALGPVAPAAEWLGPLLKSLDGATRSLVPVLFGAHPLDTDSPSNLKKLVDLIQNKIIPFVDRGPKVNVVDVGVTSPGAAPAMSAEEQTGRVIDTLRMIGVVR